MECVNAASLAELLMMSLGLEDVIGNRVGTGEKLEVGRLSSHIPEANLPAVRAIASTRVGRQVEADFEFDCAADAASVILFERHCSIARRSARFFVRLEEEDLLCSMARSRMNDDFIYTWARGDKL